MMTDLPHGPLTRLAPEVLDYAAPSFTLRDDLVRLDAVHRAGAPEAVILYCARILDALAGDALRRVGQTPSPSVFSNLQVLEHFNRLGTATSRWAHALRRLGNSVRHIHGRVGPSDVALSLLFVEGWVEWFFCRFSHGYRLPSLTRENGPLRLSGDEELHDFIRSVEELHSLGPNSPAGRQQDVEAHPAFRHTAVLPAALAEVLLARKEDEEALRVLQAGLAPFPEDLRLRQLIGLYWSRAGRLDEALRWLEPLIAEFPEDDETTGITAGVWKRRWQADRTNVADLEKSQRAYRDAWRRSARKNTYVGINSATTALWLGRTDDSRRLAREVAEVLTRRAAALSGDLSDPQHAFHYWDQVTLAEAQLLLGDWPAAQQTYDDAFARHAERRGDIEVSRRQRDEILKSMGLSAP
jgi:tetratricopeptide (TPR) repeat protein